MADYTDETASRYRPHRYEFDRIDVIVLEGIFPFVLDRLQLRDGVGTGDRSSAGGLSEEDTLRAYRTIYFPAQRMHLERDDPEAAATALIHNDGPR